MRNYFVPALLIKVLGSVAFAIVYQYYYGYGDTFGYYNMGRFFTQIVRDNPTDFFKVYFTGGDDYFLSKSYIYNFDYLYNHQIATIIVARFSSFIGLLCFGNYLFISIGFSILSFSGLWKLFRMFATLYPSMVKYFAWVILFVPSVIFWGSGLLKDSITIGALGWLTYAAWSLFFLKKNIKSSVIIIILSIWIVYQIKAYILLSFLPTMFLWIGASFYNKIRNRNVRILIWPFLIGILVFAVIEVNDLVTSQKKELSYENLTTTALTLSTTLQQIDAGSTYSLGKIDPTFKDILLESPAAIATTLYRPFLWEVTSIIMIFSALESFLVLLLTLWIVYKVGAMAILKAMFTKSIVMFCFLFSMVFSVGVAVSSGNFGTLVRYKLPAMPFYMIFLLLIFYYGKQYSITTSKKTDKRNFKKTQLKPSFQS